MKRKLVSFTLILLLVTLVGCQSNEKQVELYNHLLTQPDYENAVYRAEIGILFYETEEKVGFQTSFGIFLYNYKTEELETAIKLKQDAFDASKGYISQALMSEDERQIIISAFSHVDVFSEYYYIYDIESGNLYLEKGNFKDRERFPVPNSSRNAFDTGDWSAKDLRYYPPGSDIPHYPFKGI